MSFLNTRQPGLEPAEIFLMQREHVVRDDEVVTNLQLRTGTSKLSLPSTTWHKGLTRATTSHTLQHGNPCWILKGARGNATQF